MVIILALACSLQAMAATAESPTCPVCLKEFTWDGNQCPKLLPCNHTLCVACLVKLRGANPGIPSWIKCPQCGGFNPLPTPGLKGLPTNRYVLHAAESKKKNIPVPSLLQGNERTMTVYPKKECWKTRCPKCSTHQHEEHNLLSLVECLQQSKELNAINQVLVDNIKSLETYVADIREAKKIVQQKEAEAHKAIEEITRKLSGGSRIMENRHGKSLRNGSTHREVVTS